MTFLASKRIPKQLINMLESLQTLTLKMKNKLTKVMIIKNVKNGSPDTDFDYKLINKTIKQT